MPFFVHRLFTYTPSKPRHPLLRLGLGIIGLALLSLLLVVGLFVGIGMLLFAAARRLMSQPAQVGSAPRVEGAIDGEFSVIDKNRATLSLR